MSNQPRFACLDSELASCSLLESLLADIYHLPTTAVANPTLLLELSAQRPFDLYLMDYCFPETTAVELCRSIRALNINSPIVVYSALDRDIDRRLAAEAGADLFLSKPDDLPLLGPETVRLLDSDGVAGDRARRLNTIDMMPRLIGSRLFRSRRKGAGIL